MYKRIYKVLSTSLVLFATSAGATPNIDISGLILGEIIFSDYNQGLGSRFGEKTFYSTFCIPRTNLKLDSNLGKNFKAKIGLNFRESCGFGGKNDEWAFRRFGTTDEVQIEYANQYNASDFKLTYGIQYIPYGIYPRHTIPASFSQLLTQSQVNGITGYYKQYTSPWYVQAYIFNGKKKLDGAVNINNAGARFAYIYEQENDFRANLYFDFIYNLASSANYLVHIGNSSSANPLNSGYRKIVPAYNISMQLYYQTFEFEFHITRAIKHFEVNDLSYTGSPAKPGAYVASFAYNQINSGFATKLGVSQQFSKESVDIRGTGQGRGIPKSRTQIDYKIKINKYINSGVHLVHDKDYGVSQGGTSHSSNSVMFSILVTFS